MKDNLFWDLASEMQAADPNRRFASELGLNG